MCGIAGIIWEKPGIAAPDVSSEMLRLLAHRGPDDRGAVCVDAVGMTVSPGPHASDGRRIDLLHQRLSILDLTSAAAQPMSTPDGRYHLVFNGEIYNYVELREELVRAGVGPFRSSGDTEVLLAGYVHWGVALLPRLVGMFSFAILDGARRRLILARDFAGIKPLYYARWSGGLVFASEIKALRTLPGVGRRADAQRAYEYLHLGLTDHGDGTLYAGIRQVPAAHYLEVDLDRPEQLRVERYWRLPDGERYDLSFDEAAAGLRERFLRSVTLHMRSDVPVGAALSGGIDSSSIVSAMRHLYPESEIHTFSYIAAQEQLSEERWVDVVGRHAGAVVHKVRPSAAEMIADLDELIRVQDEPFGSTSIYAQYRVFRLAREAGIKVMLDGQGADELLGGYKLLVAARLASMVRQGRWKDAARFLLAARQSGWRWIEQVAYVFGMLLPEAVQGPFIRLWGREGTPAWLDAAWFDRQGVVRQAHAWRSHERDVLHEMLWRQFSETSLPMLLRYEDRNSMAHSIESRVPFLTPEVVAFTLRLPEPYLVAADGTTKAVFRQAMRGLVPDAILDRRDKVGFVTPERQWLGELRPWVEDVLASEAARRIPFLRMATVRAEWEAVMAGRRRFDFRVWRWINFIRWAEQQEITF